jgi:hypothetical protein
LRPAGILALAVLLLGLPREAPAAGKWTSTDTALQLGVISLQVADWGQTRAIANGHTSEYMDGNGFTRTRTYYETNVLLGPNPSAGRVNAYFAASIVGHTAVAYLLPQPYRRIWQSLFIVVEAHFVIRNDSIGLKVDF